MRVLGVCVGRVSSSYLAMLTCESFSEELRTLPLS